MKVRVTPQHHFFVVAGGDFVLILRVPRDGKRNPASGLDGQHFTGIRIPNAEGAILTGRRQLGAVRPVGHPPHRAFVAREGKNFRAGDSIQNTDRATPTGRRQLGAIWPVGHPPHFLVVAGDRTNFRAGDSIPNTDSATLDGRRQYLLRRWFPRTSTSSQLPGGNSVTPRVNVSGSGTLP